MSFASRFTLEYTQFHGRIETFIYRFEEAYLLKKQLFSKDIILSLLL